MKVSIVTVYYNREKYVIESIESLLNQTYDDIEIIIVDDGSTDNTLKKINCFSDNRIKVISHSNRGFVRSVKEGINQSTGDLIAIHGSGDISYPNRIEKQVNVFTNNKDIGVVGCFVNNENMVTGEKKEWTPNIDTKINLTQQLLNRNLFTHGEVMFNKKLYYQVGEYRDFFKFSQDIDLWLRMSLVTKFFIVPEFLYTRYSLSDGVSNDPLKRVVQENLKEYSKISILNKINNEIDIVNEHGLYSPFFRESRSKNLSIRLFNWSIIYYLQEDMSNSKLLCNLSIFEKRLFRNIIFSTILYLSAKSLLLNKVFIESLRTLKKIVKKGN